MRTPLEVLNNSSRIARDASRRVGGGTLIYIDAAGHIVVNPLGGAPEVRNAIGGIVKSAQALNRIASEAKRQRPEAGLFGIQVRLANRGRLPTAATPRAVLREFRRSLLCCGSSSKQDTGFSRGSRTAGRTSLVFSEWGKGCNDDFAAYRVDRSIARGIRWVFAPVCVRVAGKESARKRPGPSLNLLR